MTDPILISWHDSYLRRSDLATIECDEWVGDNVIAFHSEWLRTTATVPAEVRLWPPALVEVLVSLSDARTALEVLPRLEERFVVLPARAVAEAAAVVVQGTGNQGRRVEVEEIGALQRQSNGCDCGVYVLALSQSLQRVLEANLANLHPDASPNLLDQVLDEVAGYWTPERIDVYRSRYRDWLRRWADHQKAATWTRPADVRKCVGEVDMQ